MSSSSASESSTSFVCECRKSWRSACTGEPFYKEHDGKRYCVLHYPSKDKAPTFSEAIQRKLAAKSFNFRGVWFPDKLNFDDFAFGDAADFRYASFNEAVDFSYTSFAAAYFCYATFNSHAYFGNATFNAWADFSYATFRAGAGFRFATFKAEADFIFTAFNARTSFYSVTIGAGLRFSYATFSDYVMFGGDGNKEGFNDKSSLDFQFARIEKPDRVSFHTLTLRPHWFVNVDSRKFDFTNVKWWSSIAQELDSLEANGVSPSHKLLGVACRHLALNAEENHRYDQASKFRYRSMDARRRQQHLGLAPWRLSWWYWLASGYGERAWRAFVVLTVIWLLAAAIYTRVGFVRWEPRVSSESEAAEARRDEAGAPLRWGRALTYSLGVMTLQKPEPRPATNAAQTLVMVETILGPVQAALLALAIRRKFMR
jgi:uncharacterized protein YjbI with pentapeptide repeats